MKVLIKIDNNLRVFYDNHSVSLKEINTNILNIYHFKLEREKFKEVLISSS